MKMRIFCSAIASVATLSILVLPAFAGARFTTSGPETGRRVFRPAGSGPSTTLKAPTTPLEDSYCYGENGKSGPTGSWPACNQQFWSNCTQEGGVKNELPDLPEWGACING